MASFRFASLASIALLLSGCATIVHERQQPISVTSTPAGAQVTIYDRKDQVVMTDTTPFVALLDRGAGYFKSATYRMVFTMPGYAASELPLTSKVNGAYFTNIVFGVFGLVGMVAIDPATGGMYTLVPKKIEQPLSPAQPSVDQADTPSALDTHQVSP